MGADAKPSTLFVCQCTFLSLTSVSSHGAQAAPVAPLPPPASVQPSAAARRSRSLSDIASSLSKDLPPSEDTERSLEVGFGTTQRRTTCPEPRSLPAVEESERLTAQHALAQHLALMDWCAQLSCPMCPPSIAVAANQCGLGPVDPGMAAGRVAGDRERNTAQCGGCGTHRQQPGGMGGWR